MVGRLTVSQRLRAKLRALLKAGGHGTAKRLAEYANLQPQNVSYFKTGNAADRHNPIKLDQLDDIARFFRISLGELLGDTKLGDLSGDEQRLVYAFRILSPSAQQAWITVIEEASVHAQRTVFSRSNKQLLRGSKSAIENHEVIKNQKAVTRDPELRTDPDEQTTAAALAYLQSVVTRLSVELGTAVGDSQSHRPVPKTRDHPSQSSGLAD